MLSFKPVTLAGLLLMFHDQITLMHGMLVHHIAETTTISLCTMAETGSRDVLRKKKELQFLRQSSPFAAIWSQGQSS